MILVVNVIETPDAALWFRRYTLFCTTFYVLKDNVKAQLQMLEDIVDCGGAALVIFSPERYISYIDRRLLQKAEKLSLPLLQMPEGSYIDVIVPVMSSILNNQVRALEYAREIHNQMTSVILMGKGLKDLISAMANLINHPIVMVDAECQFLDFGVPDEVPPDTPMIKHLWGRYGYLELLDCYPSEVFERLRRSKKPFYRQSAKCNLVDYFFPIVAGDSFYGGLIVPDLEEEMEKEKIVATEAGSIAIALEVLKEKAVHDSRKSRKRMEMEFFSELLLGNIRSKRSIIAQAERFGLDISGEYALLLVELNKESAGYRKILMHASESKRKELEQKLLRYLKIAIDMENVKSIVMEALGGICVMVQFPEKWENKGKIAYGKKLMGKIKNVLVAKMKGTPFCIAMGNISEDIEKIGDSYLEVWETLNVGKKLLPPTFAVFCSDMAVYLLVKRLLFTPGSLNLYENIYDKLLHYDRKKGTELALTLEEYIGCNYSKFKTARKLYIHRNSLSYRLQQINKILGVDVDEADNFPFLLASIIRKLS